MSSLRFPATRKRSGRRLWWTPAVAACLALAADAASAQLAPNQTQGFGNGRLVTFTYLQNFDCVAQPNMDLDFNGIAARSDPNELQTPICQAVTEPTQDPSGGNIKQTAHLYVLIPMFSVDHDTDPADAMPCPNGGRPGELCGVGLGNALIQFFGFIPEAWKARVNPGHHDPVSRSEQLHARHLHDARFLGGPLRDAVRARQDRSSHRAGLRPDAESQPRRRQLPCRHAGTVESRR